MVVLVSKQHKVTTKYKMQTTPHFSLICHSGEDNIIQKWRASRFCCRASGFLSHLPCRTSSCGKKIEACFTFCSTARSRTKAYTSSLIPVFSSIVSSRPTWFWYCRLTCFFVMMLRKDGKENMLVIQMKLEKTHQEGSLWSFYNKPYTDTNKEHNGWLPIYRVAL